MHVARVWIM